MTIKATKSTNVDSVNSTTIRISRETKEKIENLDFVRKHTFDEILNELVEFYNKKSPLSLDTEKQIFSEPRKSVDFRGKKESLGRKKLRDL